MRLLRISGRRTPANLTPDLDRLFTEGGAKHAVLIPGVDRTLATLKRRGLRIGVATNNSIGGLKASLQRTGILDLFDFAVGFNSGHGTKPDPGMALAFCKAVGLEPGEIAVVGDAVHDLAMGRAAQAGLTVGVLSGTGTAAQLQPLADLMVDSINEMPALPAVQQALVAAFRMRPAGPMLTLDPDIREVAHDRICLVPSRARERGPVVRAAAPDRRGAAP